ncbi:MAG: hypothetical protein K6L81_07635 [Agarilytica sp.]
MSIVYLLQNQHDQYLSKAGEWLEGDAANTLYRTEHKDEAINRKVEFTVKNVELRIAIVKASLRENGTPELSSIPKNTEEKTQTSDNHGPLFDSSSPEDAQTTSLQPPETTEITTENTETVDTEAQENSANISSDSEHLHTDEHAEPNTEENIDTGEAQTDSPIQGNEENPAPNADEAREAI